MKTTTREKALAAAYQEYRRKFEHLRDGLRDILAEGVLVVRGLDALLGVAIPQANESTSEQDKPPPLSALPLVEAICRVLSEAGEPLTVEEVQEKLKGSGHESRSKNFRQLLATYLSADKLKRFRRVNKMTDHPARYTLLRN